MTDQRPIDEPTEDAPEDVPEDAPEELAHSIGAIRHKLKQAAFRHLKRELTMHLAVKPSLCKHNHRRVFPAGKCGVCQCPELIGEDWPGACDDSFTPTMPEECSHFTPLRDKEQIKAEFRDFLSTAPLHEIAGKYPDLAPLMWVLGPDVPGREDEDGDWEPGEEVRVLIYDITVTADNAEDASAVELHLADAERGAGGLRERAEKAEAERDRAQNTAELKQSERDTIQEENHRYHTELAQARAEAESLRVELGKAREGNNDLPAPTGLRGAIWRWLTREDP